MDYTERLRRLAIHDATIAAAPLELDARALALVRLAALVAVGGAGPSYVHGVETAVDAGANVEEIVDMLVGVIPIVGVPCVVTAAPKLAKALGYDTDEAFAPQSAG